MEVDTVIKLRACGTLWSARVMASVAPSPERERRTENVFHMLSMHAAINMPKTFKSLISQLDIFIRAAHGTY